MGPFWLGIVVLLIIIIEHTDQKKRWVLGCCMRVGPGKSVCRVKVALQCYPSLRSYIPIPTLKYFFTCVTLLPEQNTNYTYTYILFFSSQEESWREGLCLEAQWECIHAWHIPFKFFFYLTQREKNTVFKGIDDFDVDDGSSSAYTYMGVELKIKYISFFLLEPPWRYTFKALLKKFPVFFQGFKS